MSGLRRHETAKQLLRNWELFCCSRLIIYEQCFSYGVPVGFFCAYVIKMFMSDFPAETPYFADIFVFPELVRVPCRQHKFAAGLA